MRKKLSFIIILILFFILVLLGGIIYFNDNIRFKISYEYINKLEYNNGKKITVSIPLDNNIKYVSEEEVLDLFNDGTGILYFGYNTCPWCRNAIPVLIDASNKNNLPIYYADSHSLDINSIKEELFLILDDYLEEDGEGNKGLAVPDVYFIKDGNIVGHHLGTVDSYNNPYIKMTKEQEEELKTIYHELIKGDEIMEKLKILFMGTPEFSVNVLRGLIENYDVVGVVTQPDREVGRKREIKFSPVKELALENDIRVFQPEHIKTEYEDLLKLDVDMIVTCAYGQIIPKILLDFPKFGCINVHASLLPKLRGGAPIHKAIINNYSRTGVTIMYMVEKMDAGDIISQIDTPIYPDDNVLKLHDRLSEMGTKLLLDTIPKIVNGDISPIKQIEEEVTYAWNITREEEKINFSNKTLDIYNQIRGLSPWPGAYAILDGVSVKIYASRISESFFTTRKDGEIGKIYDDGIGVSTSDGEIIITELQIAGKRRMSVKEYLNGVNADNLIGKVFE